MAGFIAVQETYLHILVKVVKIILAMRQRCYTLKKILRRNFSVDYLISVEKSTVCLVLLKQVNEGFTHVHLQMHPLSLKRYNVTFERTKLISRKWH